MLRRIRHLLMRRCQLLSLKKEKFNLIGLIMAWGGTNQTITPTNSVA
jgi:hypothetical protein